MKDTLEFSDLSEFDVNLIKDRAISTFLNTKCADAQAAMIAMVFECIRCKGFDIVKTEREPTWAKPKASWYTEAPKHPNWWKE